MPKSSIGKKPPGGRKTGALNRGNKKGQGELRAGSALKNSSASSKAGRTAPNGDTRVKGGGTHFRSEGTIKRLKMYNGKPNMQRRKEQSLKPCRIQPDRRWFGNTRVIAQDKMQAFRETLSKGVEDPFSVVLRSSKLPMSLLQDTENKASRMDLLSVEPFKEVFAKKRRQKRVKLGNYDLQGLIKNAEEKAEVYEGHRDKQSQMDPTSNGELASYGSHHGEGIFNKGTSKRIWGELYKVLDASDVLIEVLDARDPMGTRCEQLEREVRKNHPNKHIVLLLNKVDLVPTWVSRRWIQVLMKEFPTLAFHASITNPFGKNSLLNLLRQFGTLLKEKKHVTIGMIGYPNVGKSSVINTIKRKKVCKSAPVPGETRVWQYIALTRKLYLLDCPGIVPPAPSDFDADCAKVLKGVVRAERIQCPSDYIDEVVSRAKQEYLIQRYKLPPDTKWRDGEEFLTIVARKMGKLQKGGDADLDTAARIVLYDWQRGRIPYFTSPPEESEVVGSNLTGGTAPSSSTQGKQHHGSSTSGSIGEEATAHVAAAAAAVAAAASAASAAGSDNAAEAPPGPEGGPVIEQSLEDLRCSLSFNEEDRRGEAALEHEPAKATASKLKRKHTGKTIDGEGLQRKKKLRQGQPQVGDDAQTKSGKPVSSVHLQQGSVDWKAVVSEFAM